MDLADDLAPLLLLLMVLALVVVVGLALAPSGWSLTGQLLQLGVAP